MKKKLILSVIFTINFQIYSVNIKFEFPEGEQIDCQQNWVDEQGNYSQKLPDIPVKKNKNIFYFPNSAYNIDQDDPKSQEYKLQLTCEGEIVFNLRKFEKESGQRLKDDDTIILKFQKRA